MRREYIGAYISAAGTGLNTAMKLLELEAQMRRNPTAFRPSSAVEQLLVGAISRYPLGASIAAGLVSALAAYFGGRFISGSK